MKTDNAAICLAPRCRRTPAVRPQPEVSLCHLKTPRKQILERFPFFVSTKEDQITANAKPDQDPGPGFVNLSLLPRHGTATPTTRPRSTLPRNSLSRVASAAAFRPPDGATSTLIATPAHSRNGLASPSRRSNNNKQVYSNNSTPLHRLKT